MEQLFAYVCTMFSGKELGRNVGRWCAPVVVGNKGVGVVPGKSVVFVTFGSQELQQCLSFDMLEIFYFMLSNY